MYMYIYIYTLYVLHVRFVYVSVKLECGLVMNQYFQYTYMYTFFCVFNQTKKINNRNLYLLSCEKIVILLIK